MRHAIKLVLLIYLFTSAIATVAENSKHVFWYKCIEKNYSLSDSVGGKGPNIQGAVSKHEGKALTASIRGSAGNQDPIIAIGNGPDNAQARSFVIWYNDLCDLKITEGGVLKSAKFRGEFRDAWTSSHFCNVGPLKPRVGVVNIQGHFDAFGSTPATHPDNAVWADPLNPLSGSMGFEQSGEPFQAEEYQNFNAPPGASGSGFPLDGRFFEMNITKQVQYILDKKGQFGIAAVIAAGDGSTGKINLYAFEDFVSFFPTGTKPWTKDGNTCHLLLEIENGTLEYKPDAAVERKISVTDNILLSANPNPFNPSTKIVYNCGHNKSGLIRLYSTSGRLLFSARVTGAGNMTLNGTQLSSGLYLCKLETARKTSVISLLLAK